MENLVESHFGVGRSIAAGLLQKLAKERADWAGDKCVPIVPTAHRRLDVSELPGVISQTARSMRRYYAAPLVRAHPALLRCVPCPC